MTCYYVRVVDDIRCTDYNFVVYLLNIGLMMNEKALYESIGQNLKALRTSPSGRQLTQEKLAEMVGLERTSITNIEAGNQRVSLHVLYELCNALGVEIMEVLPPYSKISEQPPQETVVIGSESYNLTPQIAALVREAN